jgi:hypothetical protein
MLGRARVMARNLVVVVMVMVMIMVMVVIVHMIGS